MPGLSSRNPVPGYGNMGKVHLRYKEKKPAKYKFGFCMYLLCLLLFVFAMTWTRKSVRYSVTLPLMRATLSLIHSARQWYDMQSKAGQQFDHTLLSGSVFIATDDSSGAIEVSAKTVEDVLYGQGYIHCAERLFQMDYNRHKAAGTLSQHIDATKVLSDKWARTLDVSGLALKDLQVQSEQEMSYLEAYSAGVNAYLAEQHPLPEDYLAVGVTDPSSIELWRPEHSLALLRLHTTTQGDSTEAWEHELIRSLLERAVGAEMTDFWGLTSSNVDNNTIFSDSNLPDNAVVLPSSSSNFAYVVSGNRLEAGGAFSSSTVVQEPESPSSMIQNTLRTDGGQSDPLHVTGASYPGVPFVILSGRNEKISWSLSPSAIDTADLFSEEIEISYDDFGNETYKYLHSSSSVLRDNDCEFHTCVESDRENEGMWKPAALRREIIIVRPTNRKSDFSEITLDCLETERGVVLPAETLASPFAEKLRKLKQQYFSLASVGRRHPHQIMHWYLLNTARSWADFNVAFKDMSVLSWNALYADASGNIGSRITGRSPVRTSGHTGAIPVEGSMIPSAWIGDREVSLSGLDEIKANDNTNQICHSCILNPSGGVILNVPWSLFHQKRGVGNDFPSFLSSISHFLSTSTERDGKRLSFEDFEAFEKSSTSPSSTMAFQAIDKAIRHNQEMEKEKQDINGEADDDSAVVTKLIAFLNDHSNPPHCDFSADSALSLFYEAFQMQLRDILLLKAGSLASAVFGASPSPFKKTTSLYENVAYLESAYGQALSSTETDEAARISEYLEVILQAAKEAFAWLERKHGSPSSSIFNLWAGWRWRKAYSMRFRHPLANLEYFGEIMSPGPAFLSTERGSAVGGGGRDSIRRIGTGGESLQVHGRDREHEEFGCLLAPRWGSEGRCRTITYRL